jgi:hypothetical protein
MVNMRFREAFKTQRIPRVPIKMSRTKRRPPKTVLSNPASDSLLVSNIVCPKLSFKVALLSMNYPSLPRGQHNERQSKRPERSGGAAIPA